MAQSVCAHRISSGEKRIILEKPQSLQRIFFSVCVVAGQATWYDVRMSFDEPHFCSYYPLNGPTKFFQAEGVDIFQGNVWVLNGSDTDLLIAATEMLR